MIIGTKQSEMVNNTPTIKNIIDNIKIAGKGGCIDWPEGWIGLSEPLLFPRTPNDYWGKPSNAITLSFPDINKITISGEN